MAGATSLVIMDRLRLRRAFDTEALAASFPFAAADPPTDPDGILYGLAGSGAPLLLDRFARENYNSVLLARSGAGKSYLAKLEALRLLFQGVQVFVLDPEDEYGRLCNAVGGVYLPLAGEHAVTLNPLDLPAGAGRQALGERTLFLAELVELLLGGLGSEELPVLERAVRASYASAGIGDDPATHGRPAPLLTDLARHLAAEGQVGASLAARLEPYATGSHSSLFAQPSSAQPDGQLVCFSLRGLPDRLKAPALLLCLGRDLALARRAAAQALRPRRRGLAVDARTGRGEVPLPARQERPQALVRTDDRHPRRRRPALLRTRAGGDRQRRHPGAAAAGAASDRTDRRGLQPVRR